eukprot:c29098_g1_i3 orf=117-2468(+)
MCSLPILFPPFLPVASASSTSKCMQLMSASSLHLLKLSGRRILQPSKLQHGDYGFGLVGGFVTLWGILAAGGRCGKWGSAERSAAKVVCSGRAELKWASDCCCCPRRWVGWVENGGGRRYSSPRDAPKTFSSAAGAVAVLEDGSNRVRKVSRRRVVMECVENQPDILKSDGKRAASKNGHLFRGDGLTKHAVHSQNLQLQARKEVLPPKMQSTIESPDQNAVRESKRRKKCKPEAEMWRALDMCSKYGDVVGALAIFDNITQEGVIKLKQHNYNVLLYLCSSAAMGTVRQGKSGTVQEVCSTAQQTCELVERIDINADVNGRDSQTQQFNKVSTSVESIPGQGSGSEDRVITKEVMDLALRRGFEIYEHMQQEGVPLNEATLTSVARLAFAKRDGDLAFETIKKMAEANIVPRLRSYGPALYTYCENGEVEKAFEVDAHMLAAGILPEESELAALLKLSVESGLDDKVYLVMHRLRTTVRELSPSTVGIIAKWFNSEAGSFAGKVFWESLPTNEQVKAATEVSGGGWHGLGWLGKGSWTVERTQIDKKGTCLCCGEPLCTIDIDPHETENFAKSITKLAYQREVKPDEFKKFQRWLNEQEPYDAVVDGANVGMYHQNFAEGGFNFQQLSDVVTEIQARSPRKKVPLIILHHRRTGGVAASSQNAQKLLATWIDTNAFYTTPTGSNDDWYWLYAAVKCRCLLVTNDEMRDHLFQLLGNAFFPQWKERHQVRFTFKSRNIELHMPPPYSIVIQESEKGSWHIPQSGGDDIDIPREWLCVTRSRCY